MKRLFIAAAFLFTACSSPQFQGFLNNPVVKAIGTTAENVGTLVVNTALDVGKTLILQRLDQARAQVEVKQLQGLRK